MPKQQQDAMKIETTGQRLTRCSEIQCKKSSQRTMQQIKDKGNGTNNNTSQFIG